MRVVKWCNLILLIVSYGAAGWSGLSERLAGFAAITCQGFLISTPVPRKNIQSKKSLHPI